MRYWWVNQNQTFEQEVTGSYMWSPQRNANGAYSQFYENMRLVEAGENWNRTGWRVPVNYTSMKNRVRPKNFISELAPTLPNKYSPLRDNGDGLQSVYLAQVPQDMAKILLAHIGEETQPVLARAPVAAGSVELIERIAEQIEQTFLGRPDVPETEKVTLSKSRRGQGQFRERVLALESRCRVTRITNPDLLIASHIKPWAKCNTNQERLGGNNGLMLSPTVDLLFDRGYISFSDVGELLVADSLQSTDRALLEIDEGRNVGCFTDLQAKYLKYHRDQVFRAGT
jgi:putative restriction endonuclease